ncbi:MAG: DUF2784 domain-containing protein [Myxococcaceae bacterium]
MVLNVLADLVVVIHLAFVAFIMLGGLLVFRWRWVAWLHLPTAIWGTAIEFAGWICPLTPLENWLRAQSGGTPYERGFVEHYLLPVLYPSGLSRTDQFVLGALVLGINLTIYAIVLGRLRCSRSSRRTRAPRTA